jgi:hypothetical protein
MLPGRDAAGPPDERRVLSDDVTEGLTGAACDCPDFVMRRAGLCAAGCKHLRTMRAVGLLSTLLAARGGARWHDPESPAIAGDFGSSFVIFTTVHHKHPYRTLQGRGRRHAVRAT